MPIRTLITVVAFFIFPGSAVAQIALPSMTVKDTATSRLPSKPPLQNYNQVIYFSVMGPGCGMSLQYDIRFNGTYKGLGARIGFGFVPEYREDYGEWRNHPAHSNIYKAKTTLPVGLNYVWAPHPRNMVDIGVGATYMSGDSLWYDDVTTSYAWLGWLTFNYRRTMGKHLIMRAGLTMMTSKYYVAPFPTPEWGMGFRF